MTFNNYFINKMKRVFERTRQDTQPNPKSMLNHLKVLQQDVELKHQTFGGHKSKEFQTSLLFYSTSANDYAHYLISTNDTGNSIKILNQCESMLGQYQLPSLATEQVRNYYLTAQCQALLKNLNMALKYYNIAYAIMVNGGIHPPPESRGHPTLFDIHNAMAIINFQLGKYAKCQECIELAVNQFGFSLQVSPQACKSYTNLCFLKAQILQKGKKQDSAIRVLNECSNKMEELGMMGLMGEVKEKLIGYHIDQFQSKTDGFGTDNSKVVNPGLNLSKISKLRASVAKAKRKLRIEKSKRAKHNKNVSLNSSRQKSDKKVKQRSKRDSFHQSKSKSKFKTVRSYTNLKSVRSTHRGEDSALVKQFYTGITNACDSFNGDTSSVYQGYDLSGTQKKLTHHQITSTIQPSSKMAKTTLQPRPNREQMLSKTIKSEIQSYLPTKIYQQPLFSSPQSDYQLKGQIINSQVGSDYSHSHNPSAQILQPMQILSPPNISDASINSPQSQPGINFYYNNPTQLHAPNTINYDNSRIVNPILQAQDGLPTSMQVISPQNMQEYQSQPQIIPSGMTTQTASTKQLLKQREKVLNHGKPKLNQASIKQLFKPRVNKFKGRTEPIVMTAQSDSDITKTQDQPQSQPSKQDNQPPPQIKLKSGTVFRRKASASRNIQQHESVNIEQSVVEKEYPTSIEKHKAKQFQRKKPAMKSLTQNNQGIKEFSSEGEDERRAVEVHVSDVPSASNVSEGQLVKEKRKVKQRDVRVRNSSRMQQPECRVSGGDSEPMPLGQEGDAVSFDENKTVRRAEAALPQQEQEEEKNVSNFVDDSPSGYKGLIKKRTTSKSQTYSEERKIDMDGSILVRQEHGFEHIVQAREDMDILAQIDIRRESLSKGLEPLLRASLASSKEVLSQPQVPEILPPPEQEHSEPSVTQDVAVNLQKRLRGKLARKQTLERHKEVQCQLIYQNPYESCLTEDKCELRISFLRQAMMIKFDVYDLSLRTSLFNIVHPFMKVFPDIDVDSNDQERVSKVVVDVVKQLSCARFTGDFISDFVKLDFREVESPRLMDTSPKKKVGFMPEPSVVEPMEDELMIEDIDEHFQSIHAPCQSVEPTHVVEPQIILSDIFHKSKQNRYEDQTSPIQEQSSSQVTSFQKTNSNKFSDQVVMASLGEDGMVVHKSIDDLPDALLIRKSIANFQAKRAMKAKVIENKKKLQFKHECANRIKRWLRKKKSLREAREMKQREEQQQRQPSQMLYSIRKVLKPGQIYFIALFWLGDTWRFNQVQQFIDSQQIEEQGVDDQFETGSQTNENEVPLNQQSFHESFSTNQSRDIPIRPTPSITPGMNQQMQDLDDLLQKEHIMKIVATNIKNPSDVYHKYIPLDKFINLSFLLCKYGNKDGNNNGRKVTLNSVQIDPDTGKLQVVLPVMVDQLFKENQIVMEDSDMPDVVVRRRSRDHIPVRDREESVDANSFDGGQMDFSQMYRKNISPRIEVSSLKFQDSDGSLPLGSLGRNTKQDCVSFGQKNITVQPPYQNIETLEESEVSSASSEVEGSKETQDFAQNNTPGGPITMTHDFESRVPSYKPIPHKVFSKFGKALNIEGTRHIVLFKVFKRDIGEKEQEFIIKSSLDILEPLIFTNKNLRSLYKTHQDMKNVAWSEQAKKELIQKQTRVKGKKIFLKPKNPKGSKGSTSQFSSSTSRISLDIFYFKDFCFLNEDFFYFLMILSCFTCNQLWNPRVLDLCILDLWTYRRFYSSLLMCSRVCRAIG